MNSNTYRRYQHYFSLFVYGFLVTTIGPHLSVISREFHITIKNASLINTFLSVGFLFGVIMAGRLLKFPRFSSIFAMVIMMISALTAFFASEIWLFLVGYAGMGIAGGAIEINSNTSIVKYGKDRSGLYLNILHFYFGIGALIGPVVASWLISMEMWKYSYLIVATLSLAIALGMVRMKCENDESLSTFGWITLFRYPVFIAGAVMVASYIGFEMSINSWLVTFLKQKSSFSMNRASEALSLFWIMMTLGRIIFGYLTIRIDRLYLLTSSLIFVAIFFGLLIRYSEFYFLDWILVGSIGFFLSAIMPLIVSLLNDHSPIGEKDANVYIMIFMGIGIMIFPYLIGSISETYNLKNSLTFLIILPIILFILSFVIQKRSN